MSTTVVDAKKRVVLRPGRPGEVYDVQCQGPGRLLLVRLDHPREPGAMDRRGCIEAMANAPLRPTMAWEELRQLTREP
jgi:hypothetical protein